MTIYEVLEKLEATGSRLEKEAILKSEVTNTGLILVFQYSLDPYRTFGISKFKMPKPLVFQATGEPLGEFLTLLDALSVRSLTGNAAKAKVEAAFARMLPIQQKWLNRILTKNLRIGATSTTINKIWPKLIPTFEVQLAEEILTNQKDRAFEIKSSIEYPTWADPKLDGLRLLAIKSQGVVTLYSRGGQVFETFPTIQKQIESLPDDNFVLDGEVMGETWNESQSLAFSEKTKKDDSKANYYTFDCMSLEEWKSQVSQKPYSERLIDLQKYVGTTLSNSNLRIVQGKKINSQEELLDYYTQCLAEGREGIMVKDLTATYKFKRSAAVRKLKPCLTQEGVITGWVQGSKGSKWDGLFGGFLVRIPNGATTRVGGGFTDAQRIEYGTNPDSYKGKIAECECQEVTKDGLLRFPVFCRFRDLADVSKEVRDLAFEVVTS